MFKAKEFDNSTVKEYLSKLLDLNDWSNIPSNIDDIIVGASRSNRGKLPLNKGYILKVLAKAPKITTEAVRALLLPNYIKRKGKPMSKAVAQEYAAISRMASVMILRSIKVEVPEDYQNAKDEAEWIAQDEAEHAKLSAKAKQKPMDVMNIGCWNTDIPVPRPNVNLANIKRSCKRDTY